MNTDTIFLKIKEVLISEFHLDADSICLENRLEDDLDLDSLDAVDLLNNLTDYVDSEPDPALFRDVRTVADIVNLLAPIWKKA